MKSNCNININKTQILKDNIDFILSSNPDNASKLLAAHSNTGDILVLSQTTDSYDNRHDIYVGGDHIAGGWGVANETELNKLEDILSKWDTVYAKTVDSSDTTNDYTLNSDNKSITTYGNTKIGLKTSTLAATNKQIISLYELITPVIDNLTITYAYANSNTISTLSASSGSIKIPITTDIIIKTLSCNVTATSYKLNYTIYFCYVNKNGVVTETNVTTTNKSKTLSDYSDKAVSTTINETLNITVNCQEYTKFYVKIKINDLASNTTTLNSNYIYWVNPYIYIAGETPTSYEKYKSHSLICSSVNEIDENDIKFNLNINNNLTQYCFFACPNDWGDIRIINADSNISGNWQKVSNTTFTIGNTLYVVYQSPHKYSGNTSWIATK